MLVDDRFDVLSERLLNLGSLSNSNRNMVAATLRYLQGFQRRTATQFNSLQKGTPAYNALVKFELVRLISDASLRGDSPVSALFAANLRHVLLNSLTADLGLIQEADLDALLSGLDMDIYNVALGRIQKGMRARLLFERFKKGGETASEYELSNREAIQRVITAILVGDMLAADAALESTELTAQFLTELFALFAGTGLEAQIATLLV